MADGRQLGPYRLIRLLGQGGMGEVWEAEREGGGDRVALKTLLGKAHEPARLRKLLDEARLCAAMEHPNIVRIVDAGLDGDRCYFAMEVLEGFSLGAVLASSGALSPGAAVAIALQALAGLAHAQECRGPGGERLMVVHRDLKPNNLFVTRSGVVKLIDFGIARSAFIDATETRSNTLTGTFRYMSPEQIQGAQADALSDLYSLAVIVREMLTGEPLFAANSEAAVLSAILWSPVLPIRATRPDVPAALDAAIMRGMSRAPAGRFPSAAAFAAALATAFPASELWTAGALAELVTRVSPQTRGVTATLDHGARAASSEEPGRARWPMEPPPAAEARGASRRVLRSVLATALALLVGAVGSRAVLDWRRSVPAASATSGPTLPESPSAAKPPSAGPSATATPPGPSTSGEPGAEPDPTAVAPSKVRSKAARASPLPAVKRGTRPAPGDAAPGLLTVDVRPGWATLRIDGRVIGPTPVVRKPVAPGMRRIEIVRPDGQHKEYQVQIVSRKEERLLATW